jgi:hypothetical protein
MRGALLTVLALACAATVLARETAPAAAARLGIRIDFSGHASCDVTIDTAAPVRLHSTDPAGDDFICQLPSMPPRRPVALTVTLPPGTPATFADFPRLDWKDVDGRWTGTASLPSSPAFVRVGGPDGRLARRARWLDAVALAGTLLAIFWTIAYTARRSAAGGLS